MLKAIIIDDEPDCVKLLSLQLKMYCPQVQVAATCTSSSDGYEKILDIKPDIVFLDIEMPVMNGFQLLEKIGNQNVKTELDWQLYLLQRRYLDYQVNIGNRIIELLTNGVIEDQARTAEVSRPKTKFQDLMDDLFSETGKKINRSNYKLLRPGFYRGVFLYALKSVTASTASFTSCTLSIVAPFISAMVFKTVVPFKASAVVMPRVLLMVPFRDKPASIGLLVMDNTSSDLKS